MAIPSAIIPAMMPPAEAKAEPGGSNRLLSEVNVVYAFRALYGSLQAPLRSGWRHQQLKFSGGSIRMSRLVRLLFPRRAELVDGEVIDFGGAAFACQGQ